MTAVPSFLHDLRVGQGVWHWKFGPGVVLATLGSGIDERVRVDFDGWGVRWLAVAFARLTVSPQLAAQPPAARELTRPDRGPGPGPTWRNRRRSPAFVEWFRPQVLTLPEYAARAAACLRALASALAACGPNDGWTDLSWLLPLRPIGLGAPQTWARLCDCYGRPDPALPGRWRRTSVRTAHYLQTRADGAPWVMRRAPLQMPTLEWELCRLANRRTDRRIGFNADSAPVLLRAAEWLEEEFALPAQPALWCQPRSGALNGRAFDLAHGFWEMWVAWRVAEQQAVLRAGPFELFDLSVLAQARANLPTRDSNVLHRLRWMLHRAALAGTVWKSAVVALVPSADEPQMPFIGVTLGTARPFGLVRHWFSFQATPRRAVAMPLHRWPDADAAMGGGD